MQNVRVVYRQQRKTTSRFPLNNLV